MTEKSVAVVVSLGRVKVATSPPLAVASGTEEETQRTTTAQYIALVTLVVEGVLMKVGEKYAETRM
jgi:hypothetical protein